MTFILPQTSIDLKLLEKQEMKCYICNDRIELNKEDIAEIKCGHFFHFDCIYYTFIANKKMHNKKDIKECPYCRYKLKKHVPVYKKDKYPVLKGIHIISNKKILNKCEAILKSGKRKGHECGCRCILNFCLRHKNYKFKNTLKTPSKNTDNNNTDSKIEFNLIKLM